MKNAVTWLRSYGLYFNIMKSDGNRGKNIYCFYEVHLC